MGSVLLAAALVAMASCTSSDKKQSTPTTRPVCAVTKPKPSDLHGEPPQALRDVVGEDARDLVRAGDLWALPTPGYRGDRQSDGSYRFKIGWWREIAGPLRFTVDRLDGQGTARIDTDQSAYPPTGFLPTNVVTSTPGCYRITGTLKGTRYDSKLRVVIKIG